MAPKKANVSSRVSTRKQNKHIFVVPSDLNILLEENYQTLEGLDFKGILFTIARGEVCSNPDSNPDIAILAEQILRDPACLTGVKTPVDLLFKNACLAFNFANNCELDFDQERANSLFTEKLINFHIAHGQYFIDIALTNGNFKLFEYLIKKGADINVSNPSGNLMQRISYHKNAAEAVKYLIEVCENKEKYKKILGKMIEQDRLESVNIVPIPEIAAKFNNVEFLKLLVEKFGYDIKKSSPDFFSKIARYNNIDKEFIDFLVDECGLDINYRIENGPTALVFALASSVENGRSDNNRLVLTTVENLIAKGADINVKTMDSNRKKTTLLLFAIQNNLLELVKFLLDRGASTDRFQNPDYLIISVLKNKVDILRLIWDRYDISAKDPSQSLDIMDSSNISNLLAIAAIKGHVEMVKFLIEEKGADVSALSSERNTPLKSALMFGRIDLAKVLEEKYGADFQKEVIEELRQDPRRHYDFLVNAFCSIDAVNQLENLIFLIERGVLDLRETNLFDMILSKCKDSSPEDAQYLKDRVLLLYGSLLVNGIAGEGNNFCNSSKDMARELGLDKVSNAIEDFTDIDKMLASEDILPKIAEFGCSDAIVAALNKALIDGKGGNDRNFHEEISAKQYYRSKDKLTHIAAKAGNLEMMHFLLEVIKCKVNDNNFLKQNPLHCAVMGGNYEAIEFLLGIMAPQDAIALDIFQRNIACLCCSFGRSFDKKVAELIFNKYPETFNCNFKNEPLISHILKSNNYESDVIHFFIERNFDVKNLRNSAGKSILDIVLERNDIDLAVFILNSRGFVDDNFDLEIFRNGFFKKALLKVEPRVASAIHSLMKNSSDLKINSFLSTSQEFAEREEKRITEMQELSQKLALERRKKEEPEDIELKRAREAKAEELRRQKEQEKRVREAKAEELRIQKIEADRQKLIRDKEIASLRRKATKEKESNKIEEEKLRKMQEKATKLSELQEQAEVAELVRERQAEQASLQTNIENQQKEVALAAQRYFIAFQSLKQAEEDEFRLKQEQELRLKESSPPYYLSQDGYLKKIITYTQRFLQSTLTRQDPRDLTRQDPKDLNILSIFLKGSAVYRSYTPNPEAYRVGDIDLEIKMELAFSKETDDEKVKENILKIFNLTNLEGEIKIYRAGGVIKNIEFPSNYDDPKKPPFNIIIRHQKENIFFELVESDWLTNVDALRIAIYDPKNEVKEIEGEKRLTLSSEIDGNQDPEIINDHVAKIREGTLQVNPGYSSSIDAQRIERHGEEQGFKNVKKDSPSSNPSMPEIKSKGHGDKAIA